MKIALGLFSLVALLLQEPGAVKAADTPSVRRRTHTKTTGGDGGLQEMGVAGEGISKSPDPLMGRSGAVISKNPDDPLMGRSGTVISKSPADPLTGRSGTAISKEGFVDPATGREGGSGIPKNPAAKPETPAPGQSRIVGGTPAGIGNYPFFVRWVGGCGGSLIHEDIVLTAAHCQGLTSNDVVVGAYFANNNNGGAVARTITRRVPHYAYTSNPSVNDFMILKLNAAATQTPIPLETDANAPAVNTTLTTIGLGRTSAGGPSSNELLKVDLLMQSTATCTSQYSFFDSSVMLCAGNPGGAGSSCFGDSGGPIFDPSGTQVGVVSFGVNCAVPPFPVFARVAGVSTWIQQQICALSANPPSSCPTRPTSSDIVFIIDESGSMSNEQAAVRNNVFQIFAQLSTTTGGEFRTGLVGFGNSAVVPRVLSPLTNDIDVFSNGLNRLVTSGGTEPGYRAVQETADGTLFGPFTSSGVTSVGVCTILISDEPSNGDGSITAASATAALDAVRGVFIGVVSSGSPTYSYQPLADNTGGSIVNLNLLTGSSGPELLNTVLDTCITRISQGTCQAPVRNTCTFYRDCLEPAFQCGDNGYPLGFGYPLCNLFLDNEDQLSPAGQVWASDMRLCMQEALVDAAANPSIPCSQLESVAFATHAPCYLNSGICEISCRDYVRLIYLINWRVVPASAQFFQVGAGCGAGKGVDCLNKLATVTFRFLAPIDALLAAAETLANVGGAIAGGTPSDWDRLRDFLFDNIFSPLIEDLLVGSGGSREDFLLWNLFSGSTNVQFAVFGETETEAQTKASQLAAMVEDQAQQGGFPNDLGELDFDSSTVCVGAQCLTYRNEDGTTSTGPQPVPPTPAPTPAPTARTPKPSSSPSSAPTASPTWISESPSAFPTSAPTHAPSASPSAAPTVDINCDDQNDIEFYIQGVGTQTCLYISDPAREDIRNQVCQPGHRAYEICEETCGKCSDTCVDSPTYMFQVGQAMRDCNWLRLNYDRESYLCNRPPVMENCPESCNDPLCDTNPIEEGIEETTGFPTVSPTDFPTGAPTRICDDDPHTLFWIDSNIGSQYCNWLPSRLENAYNSTHTVREALCVAGHPAFEICEETCGRCMDQCEDDDSTEFMTPSNGVRRCPWLRPRRRDYDAICSGTDARNICRETCNTCDTATSW